MAVTIYGDAPAFSAYMGSNYSYSATGYAKLPINTKMYDLTSSFDTSNYRFVASVPGFYLFTFNVQNGAASARSSTYLYKNGTACGLGVDSIGNGTNTNSSNGAVLVQAIAGDYFELYFQGNNSQTLTGGLSVGNAPCSIFQGLLIRSNN